jgi:membrane fusion protein (multidrug efflux system)
MDTPETNTPSKVYQSQWLRRAWAALPFLSLVLLVVIILILQSWIKSEGEIIKAKKAGELNTEQAVVNVVALDVKPGLIRDRINLPGLVRPWVELKVVAEVRGRIVAKNVTEGQRINKGDILAVIDDRDYRNAVTSAKASFRAAKAAHDRIAALFQDQLATQTQMDDSLAAMETTKAALDNAFLSLERCEIRSPMAGIADKVYLENGQFMASGDLVANILQIDRVKVQVGIPESDVDAVRRVRTFNIVIDALDARTFEGSYHYLAKSTDSLARSYRLEIEVNNPSGEILPDMFTRVEIVKRSVDNSLAVPLFALVNQKETKAVFLADNGHARLVPVHTGIQEGWQVQVTDGLAPGAQVIVVGQRDVNDGDPIKIIRTVGNTEELNQ